MKPAGFSIIIIAGLFLPGCASSTLFTTDPQGASVIVKGEERGTTPYKYSDTKVAFSSTPVTIRKDGYKELNIILKRTEQPAIGAIAGGLLLYVPLLWFAEYKKGHFYILEKIDTTDQDITANSELKIETALNRDSLVIARDKFLIAAIQANDISKEVTDITIASPVRPGKDLTRRTISQFGTGSGICLKGILFGMNYTFIGSRNWGGSISYHANIFKTRDVPSDYYDDGYRVFSPKDYVNMLSLSLLKGFTFPDRSARFGIEAGPSWVNYNKAEFELNSQYDPNPDPNVNWIYKIGKVYKYNKSHARSNTIGLSLTAKMEYLITPYAGMEFALFTNINKIQPVTGICISFNFGDVRD